MPIPPRRLRTRRRSPSCSRRRAILKCRIFSKRSPRRKRPPWSGFYLSLADGIEAITPPAYAAEWHAVQIDIFRALGEFTANIATQGLTIASMQASSAMGDLRRGAMRPWPQPPRSARISPHGQLAKNGMIDGRSIGSDLGKSSKVHR